MITFSQMPSALIADPEATFGAVRAYHVIFTETLGRAGWDMSYSQLAARMGCGRSTAIRGVEWLETKGWIVKVPHAHRPNLYSVCADRFIPYSSGDQSRRRTTPSVTHDTRGGVTHDHESGVTDDTHQESHPGESLPGDKRTGSTKKSVQVVEGQTKDSFQLSDKWRERGMRSASDLTGASE